jgi:integrase
MRLPLRREAAATLRWGEVDLDAGELRLSAEHGRKFKANQRVPLPGLAAELLAEIRPENPRGTDLVFPAADGGPFRSWSALYRDLRASSGISSWSIHDFRRAMVSITAEVRPDVSETALDRLLTHSASATNSGVKAVYQRASGLASQRIAADAWDAILRGALTGTVTQLRRAG